MVTLDMCISVLASEHKRYIGNGVMPAPGTQAGHNDHIVLLAVVQSFRCHTALMQKQHCRLVPLHLYNYRIVRTLRITYMRDRRGKYDSYN